MEPDQGAPAPAVTVEDLRVVLASSGADVVDEISFAIQPGQVLGLVGESGSGKTTVGLALLGYTRRGLRIDGGSVRLGDVDLLQQSASALRGLRGRMVSYVPQDPAVSLNPAIRVGVQLREVLEAHRACASDAERNERIHELLAAVLLPQEPSFLRRYPHQLSGGQQQRIALAMAFACHPRLVVLDEPTTGLDVTTQAHVLETVRKLAENYQVSALYISHDLAVVAELAPRVVVMYAGRIVEEGETRVLFTGAHHPYTRGLVAAIPRMSGSKSLAGIAGRAPSPGQRPPGCSFAPRCQLAQDACRSEMPGLVEVGAGHPVRCLLAANVPEMPTRSVTADRSVAAAGSAEPGSAGGLQPVLEIKELSAGYGGLEVLHDVNLRLDRGECLALVGESGSGKTTLARAIAGLHRTATGQILLDGRELERRARQRSPSARRQIQYVFQNPYGSLNPRRTVRQIVRQPLDLIGEVTGKAAEQRVAEVLEQVALGASDRYPDELSGGERQRVAIARALVNAPAVLICDEITSALDVSVQATIVELLVRLQYEAGHGMAILFVTHNLPLVRSIAQRVAVMHKGQIVELGDVDGVLEDPSDDYTRRLIDDSPSADLSRNVTTKQLTI